MACKYSVGAACFGTPLIDLFIILWIPFRLFALPFGSPFPFLSSIRFRSDIRCRFAHFVFFLSSQFEFLWNECSISVYTRYSYIFHHFDLLEHRLPCCLQHNNQLLLNDLCTQISLSLRRFSRNDMNGPEWQIYESINCHSPFSFNCSDWYALTSEMPCDSSITCSGSIWRNVLANRMLAAALSMTPCWTRLFFRWCGVSLFEWKIKFQEFQ